MAVDPGARGEVGIIPTSPDSKPLVMPPLLARRARREGTNRQLLSAPAAGASTAAGPTRSRTTPGAAAQSALRAAIHFLDGITGRGSGYAGLCRVMRDNLEVQ